MEAERREPEGWPEGARVQCGDRTVRGGCVFSLSAVTAISAYDHYEGCCKKIRAALRESRVLIKLELVNLPRTAVTTLFGRGIKYNWPSLKVLKLEGNLGLVGMKTICSALKTSSSGLDKLQLKGVKLGVKNVNYLVDMLDHTRISDLCLYSGAGHRRRASAGAADDSEFKGEELENLLSAENAKYLVRLCIGGKFLTARNYEPVSRFLQREDTLLKGLDVPVNADSLAKLLINSIPRQSKLEDIKLHRCISNRDVRNAIFDLVCNTSSIGALCNSNHRLVNVGKHSYYSNSSEDSRANEKLRQALEINRQVKNGAPVSYAIRRKMRYLYLENPDFDVTPFNDMGVALMPHVLELVARAEAPVDRAAWNRRGRLPRNLVSRDKLDGIYRLLKNCHVSELFGFPSPERRLRHNITQLEAANEDLKADVQRLEGANEGLKAEVERMKRTIDRLTAEKEERGRGDPSRPNKRAKTTDMESRVAALEADVASLKKSSE